MMMDNPLDPAPQLSAGTQIPAMAFDAPVVPAQQQEGDMAQPANAGFAEKAVVEAKIVRRIEPDRRRPRCEGARRRSPYTSRISPLHLPCFSPASP